MRWIVEKLKIPRMTRTRIVLAFAVSVIADVLQFPIIAATATGILALPGEAVDMMLDSAVMLVTCALLGFHWSLLPSFVLEALPGLDLIPTWTGCVAFVVWRRKKEEARAAAANQTSGKTVAAVYDRRKPGLK